MKDEPGNGWNTGSSWSAKGNKEVDLIDGTLHIYIYPEAIHAVDVGHAFAFTDAGSQPERICRSRRPSLLRLCG
ncbi:MAG TPA: hypothetical protein VEK08_04290 [Planctomycetota bacterium]|nr:hypothetical protein [Planctomycetota bacterium]